MIRSIKILVFTIACLATVPYCVKGQRSVKDKQNMKIYIQLDSILNLNFKKSLLKDDSVAIYAINFKLDLFKGTNNQIIVNQIRANDSLAYRLFPSYKSLAKIDYKALMGSRNRITLIIPVLIFDAAEFSDKVKYKTKDGSTLIDMKAAVNAMHALYSTIPYNNLKDANENIFHRETIFYQNNPKYEEASEEVVYLKLYTIELKNIK